MKVSIINRLSFAVIITSVLLTGCDMPKPDPIVISTLKLYEIVQVKRPKHFRVDIRDVETGRVYENKNISKHCNHWQKLKVGSQWYFTEVVYQGKETRYIEIDGIKTLCEAIRNI